MLPGKTTKEFFNINHIMKNLLFTRIRKLNSYKTRIIKIYLSKAIRKEEISYIGYTVLKSSFHV